MGIGGQPKSCDTLPMVQDIYKACMIYSILVHCFEAWYILRRARAAEARIEHLPVLTDAGFNRDADQTCRRMPVYSLDGCAHEFCNVCAVGEIDNVIQFKFENSNIMGDLPAIDKTVVGAVLLRALKVMVCCRDGYSPRLFVNAVSIRMPFIT